MTRRDTLLFYCQHHLGVGHLVRSLALATELSRQFRVVFLSGGKMPAAVPLPNNLELVNLPPIVLEADKEFSSQDGRRTLERAFQLRRERIMEVFRRTRPAVIVIEYFPFGRLQFADELLPLLEAAREMTPRPLALCTLRDIVDHSRPLQLVYDALACVVCNHLFDGVLFHCDPRFARLEETFRPTTPLSIPVHYTGFVIPEGKHLPRNGKQTQTQGDGSEVIVSVGGGRVGAGLISAAVEAYTRYGIGEGVRMTVSGGLFAPEKEWQALRSSTKAVKGLRVKRWIADFETELQGATASVSQCGYNTSLALLRSHVPALVIPYALSEKDTEQIYRARKMEKLGAVRVLESERLNGRILAREIRKVLQFKPRKTQLDMNGARNTAAIIQKLLSERQIMGEGNS